MPVVIIGMAEAVEGVVGRACDLQHQQQQGYLNSIGKEIGGEMGISQSN